MIRREFIDFIAEKTGIENKELVEKDFLLHSILSGLAKEEAFKDNFAFKGGTCLIKCYFGYYRFSEDIDFTYINQKEFENKSEKQIRKLISEKVNSISLLLSKIAKELELDFKPEKDNRRYFEFGGGNKITTFKFWYKPMINEKESFIKVQINFVEKLFYQIRMLEAKSLVDKSFEKEIRFLLPEYLYFFEPIKINAYSLNEILIEKVRAILTRKGIKARDLIDALFILNKAKPNFDLLKKQSIEKIDFMLKYEKYSENIKNKNLEFFDKFILEEENKLMTKETPKSFKKFLKEFKALLHSVKNDVCLNFSHNL